MKYLITLLFYAITFFSNAQSIYELQGQTSQSPFTDQVVSTKGIVTSIYSNAYVIQDGDSAWCGIYIYDSSNKPNLGDSIELTGTLVEYFDLTEIKTITSYKTLSTENDLPEPILLKTGEASEKWESVLVKVVNAKCTNTNLGFGEWEINDGSGALAVDDLGVIYAPSLDISYTITSPLYYSFSAYKLIPQNNDAIEINLPVYFTTEPYESDINKNGFTLNMETNVESKVFVEYGLTTSFEIGKTTSAVSSTTHNLTISNLDAGKIYHAKSYAINNSNDTTPIFSGVYATQSESTGEINTYFNHDYYAMVTKSGFTENIVDTIISYINKAETSLDITMYDLTNHTEQSDSSNYEIIKAINSSYANGVAVRFITDDSPTNAALDSLHPDIPLLRGNDDGIMHNKFLIIDKESVNNSWVVTGSVNWTYNNLFMDFNNMICIQDQSLAKAYTIEFNEMWGSETLTPNLSEAKFGKDKADNTPHLLNINGSEVELYFSPSDKTTDKIVKTIDNAESTIDLAMMVFTENLLGTAFVNAHNRGVDINGFIDYVEYSGSEFDYLRENNIMINDYKNYSNEGWPNDKTLHHKFCVIDVWEQNPVLITGTHNWSASAESKNDENTLIIHNSDIAVMYWEEIEQINLYMFGSSVNSTTANLFKVYPNPSSGKVYLRTIEGENISKVLVYNILGKLVYSNSQIKSEHFEFELKEKGLYFIETVIDGHSSSEKIIVE